jgi:MinD superfamily P-loop ATPase
LKIAVLSGKGGTGKTFISVNLVASLAESTYVDCDVEEPNGQIYFPGGIEEQLVEIEIPIIDNDKCILCGKCSDFCKFNALAIILDKVRVFSQLCHSCGGCELVCPTGAISEKKKAIGKVTHSIFENHHIISGILNVGEESGVKVISEALKQADAVDQHTVIDCPPGNGCSVMESIREADYCILVAEPTIFGLHNLKMVYELTEVFQKKVGLVINKVDGHSLVNDFAKEKEIEVIAEIPFDKKMGFLNSVGSIVAFNEEYKNYFIKIINSVLGDKS